MKYLFLTTMLVANLTACSTSSSPQQSAMPNNPLSAEDIQEEVIFRSKEREARKIKIAQSGIGIQFDPIMIPLVALNVLIDLADGDLNGASFTPKHPLQVWLDDTDVTPPEPYIKESMTVPETFQMP